MRVETPTEAATATTKREYVVAKKILVPKKKWTNGTVKIDPPPPTKPRMIPMIKEITRPIAYIV